MLQLMALHTCNMQIISKFVNISSNTGTIGILVVIWDINLILSCERDINNISHLQAYDNYLLISSSLPEAIEACIDAAGHEFDVSRQRTLLRAATYGLAFCRFSFLPLGCYI